MPPKKFIEHAVYIIDCSTDIKTKLDLLYRIFATKYFSQPVKSLQEQQCVIFINNPNNPAEPIVFVNDWEFYELDKLTTFENEINVNSNETNKESKKTVSWLDAIETGIGCFEQMDSYELETCINRIVLITDLSSPTVENEKQCLKIKDRLKSLDIWLYVLGPNVQTAIGTDGTVIVKQEEEITPELKTNLHILKQLFTTNGLVANYSNGFHLLFAYKRLMKMPYAWYVNLSIGTEFRIPIAAYKTICDYEHIRLVPYSTDPNMTDLYPLKQWYDVNTHEPVNAADVTSGYSFHGRQAVFTPEQEEAFKKPDPSPKGLSIFAFTDSDERTFNKLYIMPGSIQIITLDGRSMDDGKSLNTLIKTMRIKRCVALAKYVYNNNYNPYLYCIFPCPEHTETNCLLMAQLPYSHEFIEHFTRGTLIKTKKNGGDDLDNEEHMELKCYTYGYLDALCMDSLNLLPEHWRQNRNRMYRYEYYAKRNLSDTVTSDVFKPPVLDVLDPALKKNSHQFGQLMYEYFNNVKTNSD